MDWFDLLIQCLLVLMTIFVIMLIVNMGFMTMEYLKNNRWD